MFHLFGLLLLLGLPSEVLVMKNGKKIQCDTFENEKGMLTIHQGEKKFTLPTKLIDWKKTEALKTPPPKKVIAPKPKKTIDAHNQEHLVDLAGDLMEKNLEVVATAGFREINHLWVVLAYLDGRGPFEVILDLRSSITMLSADYVKRFNLEPESEAVLNFGLDKGKTVPTFLLPSADIDDIRKQDLVVAACRMPNLKGATIVAILGKDFLTGYTLHVLDHSLQFTKILANREAVTETKTKAIIQNTNIVPYERKRLLEMRKRLKAFQTAFEEGRFVQSASAVITTHQGENNLAIGQLTQQLDEMNDLEAKGIEVDEDMLQCGQNALALCKVLNDYFNYMLPAQEKHGFNTATDINKAWLIVEAHYTDLRGCF